MLNKVAFLPGSSLLETVVVVAVTVLLPWITTKDELTLLLLILLDTISVVVKVMLRTRPSVTEFVSPVCISCCSDSDFLP